MNHSLASSPGKRLPLNALIVLLLTLPLAVLLNNYFQQAQPLVFATANTAGGLSFSYETIASDMTVDWTGGGDFDPRGKCPDDFFGSGFLVVCKKLANGKSIKFLYHKGKKLLYRVDKDVIKGKETIGLHWVTGTQFNAKYRIADSACKGGKSVAAPNAKGGLDKLRVEYGEAVSKKRVRPGRELFEETHINPKQCRSWWDLFNFTP